MDILEKESVKPTTLGIEKEAPEDSTKGPSRLAWKNSISGSDPITLDHLEIRKKEKRC